MRVAESGELLAEGAAGWSVDELVEEQDVNVEARDDLAHCGGDRALPGTMVEIPGENSPRTFHEEILSDVRRQSG